ncbi:c-type cytochrome [Leeia aquatica]|uniref:Cytochrome c4 n=1 Tax=Leeia aquatica TaxID=2725557 RepID=A0A847SCC0_9NEIS|nr:c-type cytochrome [Leeia aquatica]NLR76507.1 cytochrome c4 [Leeia aquatica]
MKHTRLVALLLATVLATAASAEASKADPAKGQKIASTVCAACHAADGNSTVPANPRLAGQPADYLVKQLQAFKAPVDPKKPESYRDNATMRGMVANLSEEDMRNVAAYFESQKAKFGVTDTKLRAQGEKIYRGGIASKGVPACMACHGPTGAGMPSQFPRLGGQHPAYVEAQMKAFRDGKRANDPAKMMRSVAAKLSDDDIKAVAAFVAGLH